MQRVKKRWQYPPARISLLHDRHLQRLFRLAGAVLALIGHSWLYGNRYHASRLCRSIRVSQSLSTFLQQTLKFFGFVDGKSFGVGSDFCGSVFLWNSRLPVWAFSFVRDYIVQPGTGLRLVWNQYIFLRQNVLGRLRFSAKKKYVVYDFQFETALMAARPSSAGAAYAVSNWKWYYRPPREKHAACFANQVAGLVRPAIKFINNVPRKSPLLGERVG